MSNNKGSNTSSLIDLNQAGLGEEALAGVMPGEIAGLKETDSSPIAADRVSNDVSTDGRITRKDSLPERGTVVDQSGDETKLDQSITADEKKEIDDFAGTLNEPVRWSAFVNALSDEQRKNMVGLLLRSPSRPSRIESHIIGEKEGPVRQAATFRPEFSPIPVEMAAVKEEMVRIMDDVPTEPAVSEAPLESHFTEQQDMETDKAAISWENSKIREKIGILANNEAIRMSNAMVAGQRAARVNNYALFRAGRWLAEPFTAPDFKLGKWLKKPLQQLAKPVIAAGNMLARTISKPLAQYDEQVELVNKKMTEIKAEYRKQTEIENLGYEAVSDYAKELGNNLHYYADSDYLGQFISECLDDTTSKHYARVKQIIEQRKTKLTDDSDDKLAEWFEYDMGKPENIGVVQEFKKEALEKSRLMRAREASRKASGLGKVSAFFKGLVSSNSPKIQEVKPAPQIVEQKTEPARTSWFGNRLKLGLAGLAAFGMAITAVNYGRHGSRTDDEKVTVAGDQIKNTPKSPSPSITAKSAPVEASSWANTSPSPSQKVAEANPVQKQKPDAVKVKPHKTEAPKTASVTPIKPTAAFKAPKLAKVEPTPKINDNPYGEEAPEVKADPKQAESAQNLDANLLSQAEINDELAKASTEIDGISKRVKDLGEYKLPAGFNGLKEPSMKTNYNLTAVNDMLDQYMAKMKDLKSKTDLDAAKKVLKDIYSVIEENEQKKASDIFMAYQRADTPLIISTHNLMIQSRKALNGKSGKFEIQYNKKEISNNGSVVTRYQPVAVDLDSYEKEYDGYQAEITNAVLEKKPISQARLEYIHARLTWLHQQMAFVSYYLNHDPAPDTIVYAAK